MTNINITAKDLFNSNAGKGFKEAGNEETEITMIGFGIKETESEDRETKETVKKEIVVIKDASGELYSGESVVLAKRVKELAELFTEEEIKAGVPIQFRNIKAGRGLAVTFLVK